MKSLLLLLACACLIGCSPKPEPVTLTSDPSIRFKGVEKPADPIPNDVIFHIPDNFKPSYKFVKSESMDISGVPRTEIRIVVPDRLSSVELGNNLRHAARTEFEKESVRAIMVFAFRKGTDTSSFFTAGKCEFAPYGDWSRAREDVPLSDYKATVEIAPDYLLKK